MIEKVLTFHLFFGLIMSDKQQRQQSLSQQGGSYSNYESIQWNEQSQNDLVATVCVVF